MASANLDLPQTDERAIALTGASHSGELGDPAALLDEHPHLANAEP